MRVGAGGISLEQLQVGVKYDLDKVTVMVYNYDFVKSLDGYKKGFAWQTFKTLYFIALLTVHILLVIRWSRL